MPEVSLHYATSVHSVCFWCGKQLQRGENSYELTVPTQTVHTVPRRTVPRQTVPTVPRQTVGWICTPCHARQCPPHYEYVHKLFRPNLNGDRNMTDRITKYAYPVCIEPYKDQCFKCDGTPFGARCAVCKKRALGEIPEHLRSSFPCPQLQYFWWRNGPFEPLKLWAMPAIPAVHTSLLAHGDMWQPDFGRWNAGTPWVRYNGGGGASGGGGWASGGGGWSHGWELVRGGGGWSHGYDWGAGSDIIVLGSMVE